MKINMRICGHWNQPQMGFEKPWSQLWGQAKPTTYWKADLEQASINLSFFDSKMGINSLSLRAARRRHLFPSSLYACKGVLQGLRSWGPRPWPQVLLLCTPRVRSHATHSSLRSANISESLLCISL